MLTSVFSDALITIARRLHAARINWAVIGSTSLVLLGMDAQPNDIDIIMLRKDLNRIPALFSDVFCTGVIELKTTTKEKAWHVKLSLAGAPIEFVGEDETGLYARHLLLDEIAFSHVDAVRIPCLTLEANAQAYDATNRTLKAERIRDFIRTKE